jgi:hypothetical protein
MNVFMLRFIHSIITSSFSFCRSTTFVYINNARELLTSSYYFVILFLCLFGICNRWPCSDHKPWTMRDKYALSLFLNCCQLIDVIYANYWLNKGRFPLPSLVLNSVSIVSLNLFLEIESASLSVSNNGR